MTNQIAIDRLRPSGQVTTDTRPNYGNAWDSVVNATPDLTSGQLAGLYGLLTPDQSKPLQKRLEICTDCSGSQIPRIPSEPLPQLISTNLDVLREGFGSGQINPTNLVQSIDGRVSIGQGLKLRGKIPLCNGCSRFMGNPRGEYSVH